MNAISPILAGDGDDAFRSSVVGASEVSALFGCNPWLTEFELWHRKAGNVATPDFAHNERTFWGTILEPVILAAASERYRSEEHTSELQSLMRISYAVFCLKKKNTQIKQTNRSNIHNNNKDNP